MKSTQRKVAVRVMTLAVQGVLATMMFAPIMAQAAGDDPGAAALINPTNSMEIGVKGSSDSSYKFGEYNGLSSQGASLIGNLKLQGGDAYGQGTGTTRWSVTGTDLGTTSRELGATVSNQGTWSLGVGFDQLRHNITDSYSTPYQGTMGGNSFSLPPSFGVLDTTSASRLTGTALTTYLAGSNSGGVGALALTPAQLAAFHAQDVYSERKNSSLTAGYNFNREWSFSFNYKRIDQSGAKLISSGTDASDLSAVVGGIGAGYDWGGEKVAVLMNPTEFRTDNFTLALNWMGDKGYFTGEYYGSLFHDEYTGVSFANPWVGANRSTGLGAAANGTFVGVLPVDTMATPPSNKFNQVSFSGGYHLSSATMLVGGLSYAHNTQNSSYDGTYTPGTVPGLPVNSLDGSVITTHADLKLTQRASSALDLSAGLKYNERDNRTASYTYNYLNLGGDSLFAVNAPMSNKRYQLELAGDFRIDPKQKLHLGYEFDNIKRWCNNSLANNAQGEAPADGSATPINTSCAQVPQEKENRLVLGYKLRANDAVNFNAGYTHAKRNSDVNSAFYNPMQSFTEGYENVGFLAFFQASRTEDQAKLGVNWQANRKLDFGLSGRYGKDDYDSTFGVQQGTTGSINLDASYYYSEKSTVSAYATTQRRTRDMTNGNGRLAGSLATTAWTNNLTDNDLTLGIGGKQRGLMGGKWDLSEDLTYSQGKTDYSTGSAGITCTTSSCGAFPTINSKMTSFKLTGSHKFDKVSQLVLGYQYQHLESNDPTYYQYYQLGYKNSALPDFQQEPSYTVNTVFAAYKYSFR